MLSYYVANIYHYDIATEKKDRERRVLGLSVNMFDSTFFFDSYSNFSIFLFVRVWTFSVLFLLVATILVFWKSLECNDLAIKSKVCSFKETATE